MGASEVSCDVAILLKSKLEEVSRHITL